MGMLLRILFLNENLTAFLWIYAASILAGKA